ncbi:C-terminal binding protein [Gemelliphila palaticanis]|uniref:C-terminal binding protein n=1 Tax=Gemelliphila palaticanis TaxID=81950 RepID=UPI001C54EC17|nr:C-terminal binding protein [Gemella palaticanis]
MIKIVRLFEDNMLDYEIENIKKLGLDVSIEVKVSNTEEEIINNAKDADIVIAVYEPITKKVLDSLPNLKLVVYRSIGFNSVDIDYANEINMPVSHISKYCVDEVANYVVSAILMHNRRINEFDKLVKINKIWDYEAFPDMRRLSVLTVGLIGFGNIPKLVSERIKAFGAKVIAYDPYVSDEVFEKYGVEKVSLEEIFKKSDYISSHLPYNKHTDKILNKDLFELSKDGSVFINSSRGGVVNEEDLYNALKNKKVSYAILDVLSTEDPDLENTDLLKLSNTVITPHIAFYSKEAFIQGVEDNFNNISEFLKGNYKNAEIVNLTKINI